MGEIFVIMIDFHFIIIWNAFQEDDIEKYENFHLGIQMK